MKLKEVMEIKPNVEMAFLEVSLGLRRVFTIVPLFLTLVSWNLAT